MIREINFQLQTNIFIDLITNFLYIKISFFFKDTLSHLNSYREYQLIKLFIVLQMRILLTIHEKFLPDSGSAGSTFRLGQEYERLGHEVSFFSLDDMPTLQRQVKRFVFPEFVASHINKLTRTQDLDVVDSSPGDNWLWGAMAHYTGKQRPVVVTRSHGLQHLEHIWHQEETCQGRMKLSWFYYLYRGGYLLWEVGNSFRYADLAFFLNQKEADFARQHLQITANKIRVFPNGIPDAFMNIPLETLSQKSDDIIRIAHIGTYIQRKGIEYSVPALKNILKKYPHVEVSFIGTGFPHLSDPKQAVYKDFEPKFHPRLKVIPSYPHETLPQLLKQHDINVFASLSEGFGKTLIEAMACGLAPITSNADGPMEIVQADYDALVIPMRDSTAIEEAIEKLIKNRKILDRIRLNAYETAQKYSWNSIARNRIAEYEKALNR